VSLMDEFIVFKTLCFYVPAVYENVSEQAYHIKKIGLENISYMSSGNPQLKTRYSKYLSGMRAACWTTT
jgi:hypothetical protein